MQRPRKAIKGRKHGNYAHCRWKVVPVTRVIRVRLIGEIQGAVAASSAELPADPKIRLHAGASTKATPYPHEATWERSEAERAKDCPRIKNCLARCFG